MKVGGLASWGPAAGCSTLAVRARRRLAAHPGQAPPASRPLTPGLAVMCRQSVPILCPAGEWQFIMGSAASESLFQWKRVTDWLGDTNCTVRCVLCCVLAAKLRCASCNTPCSSGSAVGWLGDVSCTVRPGLYYCGVDTAHPLCPATCNLLLFAGCFHRLHQHGEL